MSMSESAPGRADSSNADSDKDSSVECPTCGRTDFATEQGMKMHHSYAHGESIAGVQVSCDRCGEVFRRKPNKVNRSDVTLCQSCVGDHLSENYSGEDSWNYKRKTVRCDYCDNIIEKKPVHVEKFDNQFCDRSCYAKYQETLNKEQHPSWKGGYSQDYGTKWQEARMKAIKRDLGRCQWCGADERVLNHTLEVHHITPVREFDKKKMAHALNNLVTLCKSCHARWEGIPLRPQFIG